MRADQAYFAALDTRAGALFARAREQLQRGALTDGLRTIQQLLDDHASSAALVEDPTRRSEYGDRTFVPLGEAIVHYLLELGDRELVAEYRHLFDARARALRKGSSEPIGARQLGACFRRFPLATGAGRTLLEASEIHLAEGRVPAARRSLRQLLDAGEGAFSDAERDEARDRLAVLSRALSSPATGPPKPLQLPVQEGDCEIGWTRRTISSRSPREADGACDYFTSPVLTSREVTVQSGRGFSRFVRSNGDGLPVTPIRRASYREVNEQFELHPTLAGSILVASTVTRATRHEGGYRGPSVIRPAMPQRALQAYRLSAGGDQRPAALWTTAQPSPPNELLSHLSFGGRPLVWGDRLYSLAWRQSGYADVFLVCLDVTSGSLHHATLLVSNQCELTRFGELAHEPILGQLARAGDTIYASTNLGAIAAVSAADGRLRWLAAYRPVRPPRSLAYRRRFMPFPYQPETWWHHGPILVEDGIVVAAPQDSWHLFTFDGASGALIERFPVQGDDNRLIGFHDGALVTRHGRRVVLRSLRSPRIVLARHLLLHRPVGPAVLHSRGLLYPSVEGLACFDFSTGSDGLLHEFRESESPLAGRGVALAIDGDGIVEATPYSVRSYQRRGE